MWENTVGLLSLPYNPNGLRSVAEIDNRALVLFLVSHLHSWLQWICTMPKPLPGFVQGVLPPLFLAILFLLLPHVLRGRSTSYRMLAIVRNLFVWQAWRISNASPATA